MEAISSFVDSTSCAGQRRGLGASTDEGSRSEVTAQTSFLTLEAAVGFKDAPVQPRAPDWTRFGSAKTLSRQSDGKRDADIW